MSESWITQIEFDTRKSDQLRALLAWETERQAERLPLPAGDVPVSAGDLPLIASGLNGY